MILLAQTFTVFPAVPILIKEQINTDQDEHDVFLAEFTLFAGELNALMNDLIEAFGGERRSFKVSDTQPSFNQHDRMRYHPDFHDNQGKPWTAPENTFLINNYEMLGPEECSLHLGRTIGTIYDRACHLRKNDLMLVSSNHKKFKRTLKK